MKYEVKVLKESKASRFPELRSQKELNEEVDKSYVLIAWLAFFALGLLAAAAFAIWSFS
jgi:hypothetical protein